MPKRGNAWLIPKTIAPAGRRCVLLYIPDERDHIAAFWGCLFMLGQWVNWERDDAHSGAELAKLWRGIILDARKRFKKNQCEITEPEQPVPVVPQGESVGRIVSGSGLTLEELEDFYMTWSLRGQLAYVDGKLCYWNDGCCEWTPIPIVSGITPIAITKPSTEISLQEWEDLGEPPGIVPGVPAPPMSNSAYTGQVSSIRCAKATALIATLKDTLNPINEVCITLGGVSAWSVAEIAQALIAAGLSGGWSVAAGIALAIAAVVVETSLATMAAESTQWLADEDLWVDLICTLTGALTEGETITDLDVKQLIYYFTQAIGGTPGNRPWIIKLLYTLPIFYWKELTQPDVADTDCGCETYLPRGYTPPASQEAVYNFMQVSRIDGAGTNNVYNLPGGATLQDVLALQAIGNWDGSEADSVYAGQISSQYYSGFGIIFEFPVPSKIDDVHFDMTWDGASQASGGTRSRGYAYCPADQTWHVLGNAGAANTGNNVIRPAVIAFAQDVSDLFSHIYIQIGNLVNTGEGVKHFHATPKISGVRDSVPFLLIGEGDPIP